VSFFSGDDLWKIEERICVGGIICWGSSGLKGALVNQIVSFHRWAKDFGIRFSTCIALHL